MGVLEYEQARGSISQKFNLRLPILDQLVDEARPPTSAAKTDLLPDEQPYQGPVELRAILNECLAEISKYIFAERHQLVTLVLWAAMAHLVRNTAISLNVAPRLAIQAPDMGSGKTVTLEVLSCLCPRAEMASSITAAAVFRFISACKPTLMIDEADRLFKDKNELIVVLNSGHRRSSAYVFRTEENPQTGEWEPNKFSTWAAIAFAGIGRLPPTLQDRSIAFVLKRAKPGEVKRHLRDGSSPELTLQRRKLAAWAAQIVALPDLRMPDGLFNRHGDNWRPLLQIADAAGGEWPAMAREAARHFSPSEGYTIPLLKSIRAAFGPRERMKTSDLLDALYRDKEYEWETANRGRPITAQWLRDRLKLLIDPPESQRWKDGKKDCRGYCRSQFDDAFARYLPPDDDDKEVEQQPGSQSRATDPSDAATNNDASAMAYRGADHATPNVTPAGSPPPDAGELDNFGSLESLERRIPSSVASGVGSTDTRHAIDIPNVLSSASDGSGAAAPSAKTLNGSTIDSDEELL
jgi:hypothetical protein